MDAFDYAYSETFGYERGESNDPDDRGGKTIDGITEATFRSALERGIISGVSRLEDLTLAQKKAIYRTDYWNAISLNGVFSVPISAEMFDTAVNMGPGTAVKIAQSALCYLGEHLTIDGKNGPKTLEALNRWIKKDERALFICMNGFQFMRYVALNDAELVTDMIKNVRSDPRQVKFSRGWTKRIQNYRKAV